MLCNAQEEFNVPYDANVIPPDSPIPNFSPPCSPETVGIPYSAACRPHPEDAVYRHGEQLAHLRRIERCAHRTA